MSKVLVAGIGNVFLGDDGFGVEVAGRLARRPQLDGVEVGDFGIRGLDLAYALMDGYDAAILVDALPRGEPAGTVYVMEPDLDQLDGQAMIESHAMNPVEVLRLVKQMGGSASKVYVVGCEPGAVAPDGGFVGLSEPVEAAVDEAVTTVEKLVEKLMSVEVN